MSQGVVAGGLVYLAGQVADNTNADVNGQTAEVLARIDALLAKAGSSKSKLLTVTIYLKDIKDFAAMNQVWDSWVAADGKPARATVQAALDPALFAEAFADGRYWFRVTVSDRLSNPPPGAREDEIVSAPILIDRTPPVADFVTPDEGSTTILSLATYSVAAARFSATHMSIPNGMSVVSRKKSM